MEIEDTPAGQISISFPLGLALLVALLLFISCFFCCCLHWDKLQSMFPSSAVVIINPQPHQIQAAAGLTTTASHHKPGFPVLKRMQMQKHGGSLPVLMPGDEIPKFIALECPCQPPKDQMITVHVDHKTAPSGFCT
ncbi:hypothetical protein SESBI_50175 [Sesbania bispinosa]|nr:hypothetical protein SESBI_50175 [Sesbania bispinosa]